MAKTIDISLTEEQIKRFYSRVKIDEITGCHIFTYGIDIGGYGRPTINKKRFKAHRVAWTLAYGKIPEDMCVLHKCDNPPCINPEHLFLGTKKDNSRDMANKGRCKNSAGENNPRVKLKEYQVLEILNIVKQKGKYWGIYTELAKIYNVNHHTISDIFNKKSWKYLTTQ
jgi:hypothetical protein